MFSAVLLIFANVMVMLGAVKNKQQYLLPWLVITSIAILAAIIYCVVKWDDLIEFRVSKLRLDLSLNDLSFKLPQSNKKYLQFNLHVVGTFSSISSPISLFCGSGIQLLS